MLKKISEAHPEVGKKQQLEVILKKWEKMPLEQREKYSKIKSNKIANIIKKENSLTKLTKKEKKKEKENRPKRPKSA
jgi:hypothetical protein